MTEYVPSFVVVHTSDISCLTSQSLALWIPMFLVNSPNLAGSSSPSLGQRSFFIDWLTLMLLCWLESPTYHFFVVQLPQFGRLSENRTAQKSYGFISSCSPRFGGRNRNITFFGDISFLIAYMYIIYIYCIYIYILYIYIHIHIHTHIHNVYTHTYT